MARAAEIRAHRQLCRCCETLKPASDFGVGDSFCTMCRDLIGPLMQNGQPASKGRTSAPAVILSTVKARLAAAKHGAALDHVLAALFSDGGMWAVQLGTADAVKRLAVRKRDELSRQGWII